MATTYTLIASTTLSSTASSVSFTSIANTFTDLVLKCSLRSSTTPTIDLRFQVNNDSSSTLYSTTYLKTYGGSPSSGRHLNRNFWEDQNDGQNGAATANTFGNIELYIPNYTVSSSKCASLSNRAEDNALGFTGSGSGNAAIAQAAFLWRDTTAINRLDVVVANMVSGSSFFLYGIKNS